jgi:hypothetical protein
VSGVREIDALVYELYGLIEGEIASVEGAGSLSTLKAPIPLKGGSVSSLVQRARGGGLPKRNQA